MILQCFRRVEVHKIVDSPLEAIAELGRSLVFRLISIWNFSVKSIRLK
jgi:hypothetical protein